VRPSGWGGEARTEAEGIEGPKGLSNSHIRPRERKIRYKKRRSKALSNRYRNKIIYHPGAQLVQVKQPRKGDSPVKNASTRGKITTFSPKSRRRMMNLIATLERKYLPLFVTLTYPELYPSAIDSKRDLKVFIQRIKRLWPASGYIWKFEFQKRGAPHYHMFLWGVEYKDALKHISICWYEVCGTNDPKHLIAGTRVEQIRNHNGIMRYASKYLGKIIEEDIPEGLGRLWGYGGNIPLAEGIEFIINDAETARILRYLRRRIKKNNKGIRAFYLPYPERWLDVHGDLTGDEVPF